MKCNKTADQWIAGNRIEYRRMFSPMTDSMLSWIGILHDARGFHDRMSNTKRAVHGMWKSHYKAYTNWNGSEP